MKPNVLGFDEVVDTAVDIIEIGKTVADALEDGLDIGDAGAVLKIAPRLMEVYRDGNVAYAQLLDLTPGEAAEAVAQIADRAELPTTGVLGRINEALNLLSRTYQVVMDNVNLAGDWIAWARSLKPADAAQG